MQRKQFNIKSAITAQNPEDFNDLNVIKTDYKTQQRQKEIINVISEMSSQISASMAKCMQSFISQIDGQKPVDAKLDYLDMGGSNQSIGDGQVSSNSKGDISQQIMDTHGSRVKKYGLYID